MSTESISKLEELKLARKPFPLSHFLMLIHAAPRECYINHLEGVKVLHSWVTNLGRVPLLDDITTSLKRPNILLTNYYQQELATLLSGETYGAKFDRMHAIIYTLLLEWELG